MFKIDNIIDSYFSKKIKNKRDFKKSLLFLRYKEAVGDTVARNTKLAKVDKETIYIICRNSLWMNELLNMQDKIIKRFNEELGYEAFSKVSLRVGNIADIKKKVKPSLTDEDMAWIGKLILTVQPEIRESFKKLLEAYKASFNLAKRRH
jgi:hypothetical protein